MASELTSDTVTSLTCLGFLPVGSHFGLLSIALNPIWGCLPGFTALPGEQVQKVLLLLGPVEDFFRFLWKKEKKTNVSPYIPFILLIACFPASFWEGSWLLTGGLPLFPIQTLTERWFLKEGALPLGTLHGEMGPWRHSDLGINANATLEVVTQQWVWTAAH